MTCLSPYLTHGGRELAALEPDQDSMPRVIILTLLPLGICQTSCPLISCGVSDFRGAVFVFGVEPDWSSRLPVSGFA